MTRDFSLVSDAFWMTVTASVYASLLIGIVLLIRRVLAKRISSQIVYIFWLIVVGRLLFPTLPESSLSFVSLLENAKELISKKTLVTSGAESASHAPVHRSMQKTPEHATRSRALSDGHSATLPAPSLPRVETMERSFAANSLQLNTTLAWVWMIVCLVLIARTCVTHFRTVRFVRKLPRMRDNGVNQLFDQCKSETGVRRDVQLLASETMVPPALFGVFKPRIILPRHLIGQLAECELRFLFLHELAHLKRQDVLVAFVTSLLVRIHWFNPLIWYAEQRMCEDREIACDEVVLRKIRTSQRTEYGKTILKVLEQLHIQPLSAGTVAMTDGKQALKRRLLRLLNFQSPSWRQHLFTVPLLLAFAATALTQPDSMSAEPTQPNLPRNALFTLGDSGLRHDGDALFLEFSDDGKWLACSSVSGKVFLFDAVSGDLARQIEVEGSPPVRGLAFSPTGLELIVGAANKLVTYSVPAGVQKRTSTLDWEELLQLGVGWSFQVSKDGRQIAIYGDRGGQWLMLDSLSGNIVRRFGQKRGRIYEASFAPNGKSLATAHYNPGVLVWGVTTGELEGELPGHDYHFGGQIHSHAYRISHSPDGHFIATAAVGEVFLWNSKTKQVGHKLKGVRSSVFVTELAFTPDSKLLACGIQEKNGGRICLWDTASGQLLHELHGQSWILRNIAISPDGKKLAASFAYNRIRVWNLDTGDRLFEQQTGHDAPVAAIAYSSDGKQIATGSGQQQILIWDALSGTMVGSLETRDSSSSLEFLPDGRLLSGWQHQEGVAIWDWRHGERKARLMQIGLPKNNHHHRASRFVGETGTLYVAGFDRRRQTVQFTTWDVKEEKRSLKFIEGEVRNTTVISISPNGEMAAIGDGDRIRIWRLAEGEQVAELTGHERSIKSLAFSADGHMLVSGSLDGTIRRWRCDTFEEELTIAAGQPIAAVTLSSDGKIIAAGGGAIEAPVAAPNRGQIVLWDAKSGKERQKLPGNASHITALAFSPDDTQLTSGHQDGSLVVWNVEASASQ